MHGCHTCQVFIPGQTGKKWVPTPLLQHRADSTGTMRMAGEQQGLVGQREYPLAHAVPQILGHCRIRLVRASIHSQKATAE